MSLSFHVRLCFISEAPRRRTGVSWQDYLCMYVSIYLAILSFIILHTFFELQLHVSQSISGGKKKKIWEFGVTQQNESDSHLAAYLA